jgi:hypothetical protein
VGPPPHTGRLTTLGIAVAPSTVWGILNAAGAGPAPLGPAVATVPALPGRWDPRRRLPAREYRAAAAPVARRHPPDCAVYLQPSRSRPSTHAPAQPARVDHFHLAGRRCGCYSCCADQSTTSAQRGRSGGGQAERHQPPGRLLATGQVEHPRPHRSAPAQAPDAAGPSQTPCSPSRSLPGAGFGLPACECDARSLVSDSRS